MTPRKDREDLTINDKRYVHTYDYHSRRVRTLVYAWDPQAGEGGEWSGTASEDRRFVYHQRLRLLNLDPNNAVLQRLTWGPGIDDPPDSPGTLLAVRDVTETASYLSFGDGAGNRGQLVDRSDGSMVAIGRSGSQRAAFLSFALWPMKTS